jgi:hypothetical protein
MQPVPIISPKVYDKDKTGKELSGQFGPYRKLTFTSPKFPNEYLSIGFIKPGHPILNSKDGDVLNLVVDEAPKEFGGKLYRNCRLPKEADKVNDLESRLRKLEDAVFGPKKVDAEDPFDGF